MQHSYCVDSIGDIAPAPLCRTTGKHAVAASINGVGDVNVFGGKDYAMRVWLDPAKMASYGLVPGDVVASIGEQSLEAAAGSLGQNAGESFEYVLKYGGRYKTADQYENIIIKDDSNSQFDRFRNSRGGRNP